MTSKSSVLPPLARNVLWPALLAVAAIGGSWALACVTPFAAFAAVLAESERPGTALVTMASIWLANQAVGVLLLGYPLDAHSVGWGVAIGAAALSATLAAIAVTRLALPRGLRLVVAFAAAFVVYEAALASVAAATGELAEFAPAIVGQLAVLEAAWLVALVALQEGLAFVGWRPADRRLAA
jgi:NhaP-type Na+/H+ and K+/H+ antiporter